jgi:hypothetical protein
MQKYVGAIVDVCGSGGDTTFWCHSTVPQYLQFPAITHVIDVNITFISPQLAGRFRFL